MRKYYADIDLYFDDMKHGIVGDASTSRNEMVELIKDYAKKLNLECNTKTKKLFDKSGKEVGRYSLTSRVI